MLVKNLKNKILLEYIWLDGYETKNIRSKVKVFDRESLLICEDGSIDIKSLPVWNFDGSSTMQADGSSSECLLNPVRVYCQSPGDLLIYVFCEVMNPDMTVHESNTRSSNLKDSSDFWWGFEQEYFMVDKSGSPVGFPDNGYPKPQGMYYCGVGSENVKYRNIAQHHMLECLELGIDITGTNAEVALGQWEYQCFAKNTLKACDDLWMSRYLLLKISESYNVGISFDPKPVPGDWNGSGCHTNFSTKEMRNYWSEDKMKSLMKKLEESHEDSILVYGKGNEKRLTGLHETQHIDSFSWGVADRGASIRVPSDVKNNNWNGYIEDRRPASNCDPYLVSGSIINTYC